MGRAIVAVSFGLLLIVTGLALAADYRGIAARHIELAQRLVRPIGLGGRTSRADERPRDRFILFDRAFGMLMVLLGVVALTGGAYLLASQA
ncbi:MULTISPECIES: hypothetical protein [Micromonospora]|uniref:hypothetical protein n=1 Tax=Micromonospora TaxID=1873 RepID=UPI000A7578BD|nr:MULTISPECIES: hypothetical protein [Micromonospora]